MSLSFDPLLRLLDDPALLDALLAGGDPDLAAAVALLGPLPGAPVETPAAPPAGSAAPEPLIDDATRAELVGAFGLDPTLFDDVDALIAAIAAVDAPPADEPPEIVSGEPAWDPAWSEPVREDWTLG